MRIGEVARRAGVRVSLIRYYEAIGLLPEPERVSGQRRYDETVLPQLETKGKVERAWIGVGITNLPDDKSKMFYPTDHGVMVGRVEKGGPAERAGLETGDVILELGGRKLMSSSELIREVGKRQAGDSVDVVVSRQGQTKTFKLKLDKMPEQAAAAPGLGGEDEGE